MPVGVFGMSLRVACGPAVSPFFACRLAAITMVGLVQNV